MPKDPYPHAVEATIHTLKHCQVAGRLLAEFQLDGQGDTRLLKRARRELVQALKWLEAARREP